VALTAPSLSGGELSALRALNAKTSGSQIPFVNIRDARALTELGLAVRSREGWDITAEGSARLALEPDPAIAPRPALREVVVGEAPEAVRPLLVERWIYLRMLLLQQLEAFETGALQLRSGEADLSAPAMEKLKAEIRDFDVLIAAI
jgi:hypothetical protein